MKKILFSFFVLALLSACGFFSRQVAESSPTKNAVSTLDVSCISLQPTQDDINRALGFTKLFDTALWERSYLVMEGRVSVTWINNTNGAVTFLEALIFPCGYIEDNINSYFSDENWEIIFSNYESHKITAECRKDSSLRLYELSVFLYGLEYATKYWVVSDIPTRVITLMLVFPLDNKSVLDKYAHDIFPTLATCK